MPAEVSIVKRPVGPEDIALCMALPTDLPSFERCWGKPPERGDYLKRLTGEEPAAAIYSCYYAATAERLSEFISEVKAVGVAVFREATLASLTHASTQRDIVVFAGHWKGHELAEWDFLEPPALVFDMLRRSDDILVRSVAKIAEASEPNLQKNPQQEPLATAPLLRSALNRAMTSLATAESIAPGTLDGVVQKNPAAIRERIDQALGSAIVAGNRFEMADRFVDAYTFADALQNEREGIVDCVVCKSDMPAPAIRRERKLIQPITAAHDQHPSRWPNLIEATVRLLARSRMSYWQARELSRDLLWQLAKERK